MKSFKPLTIKNDLLYDGEGCKVHGLAGGKTFWLNKGTFFLILFRGQVSRWRPFATTARGVRMRC